MNSNYEQEFESIRDRSIIISDLIEQILLVEEVIMRHRAVGSNGLQLEQYINRRQEFQQSLNDKLSSYQFELVKREAA